MRRSANCSLTTLAGGGVTGLGAISLARAVAAFAAAASESASLMGVGMGLEWGCSEVLGVVRVQPEKIPSSRAAGSTICFMNGDRINGGATKLKRGRYPSPACFQNNLPAPCRRGLWQGA